MDLTEAEEIKKVHNFTKELYKKGLNDPYNHDGLVTHLETDTLECKVGLKKHYLRSIPLTKASGILYIENPKDTIRKLLELIYESSKVAGYKINSQKSLAFLYTNNEESEREIKESIPFTTVTKRIKYLGINPT